MKRLVILLFLCNLALADIEKVNEVALPYWPESIRDPNQIEPYMRELVSELEKVINQIRDAVNYGVDLDNPTIRYYDLPDANGTYADDTTRIIQVDTDDFEIQRKINGTWTLVGGWSYGDGLDIAGDKVRIRTILTPYVDGDTSGSPGQWAWDTNYLHVCVADGDWRRIALSHWDALLLENGDYLLLENGSRLLLE